MLNVLSRISVLLVAIWYMPIGAYGLFERRHSFKEIPSYCSFLNNGIFFKICQGTYPLDVHIRYKDNLIDVHMPYAIYHNLRQKNMYFFSFRMSELHACHKFHRNSTAPTEFTCLDHAEVYEDPDKNTTIAPARFNRTRKKKKGRRKWKGGGGAGDAGTDDASNDGRRRRRRRKPKRQTADNPEDGTAGPNQTNIPEQATKKPPKRGPSATGDGTYVFPKVKRKNRTTTTTTTTPAPTGPTEIYLVHAVLYCFHYDVQIADELLDFCYEENHKKFDLEPPRKVVMHYTLATNLKHETEGAMALPCNQRLLFILLAFLLCVF